MKKRWHYACLCLVISLSLGWQLILLQIPTDTLIGDASFLDEQYLLREIAPVGSGWAENGMSVYRSILRVDTLEVTDWLTFNNPSGWQTGTQHQYLVERRDGEGKRVITITLTPARMMPYAWLIFLSAISYTVVGIVIIRQKTMSPIALPLLLTTCGVWLEMPWLVFGVPFSYVVLQIPFWLQLIAHELAQILLIGSIVHIALVFPRSVSPSYWLSRGIYSLFPLGVLIMLVIHSTPAEKLSAVFQWEQQITIALKAIAYLLWATQYRRAGVRERGQLHWLLAGITAYDLVYLVHLFSSSGGLLWMQAVLGVLLPFSYLLAVFLGRSWRWTFEGTSGMVHGTANTLTLALFLCGMGLATSVLFTNTSEGQLPTVTLVLSIGFALTTVPLANLLREQFDSWFHGTRSAQRALLHEFTGRVSTQITLSEVVKAFDDVLDQGVQPIKKALWLWNDETQSLQQWGESGMFIALQPALYDRLVQINGFIYTSQFEDWTVIQGYYGFIPLVVSRQMIGVCVIGERMNGRGYPADVLRFLETLSRPATLALRNAQLVELLENNVIALQQSYQQLIVIQENERSHLATELHDETLQQLAHVNLLAGELYCHIPDKAAPQLKQLQTTLTVTERGLREILRGLHPAVLKDLGLIPALRSWLPQSDQTRIELITQGFEQRLPDAMLELTLYRLCQESVNNALKHARAGQINIRLIWQTDAVMLEIADDGIGFEPAAFASKYRAEQGHFGLINLRERVSALDGQLQINSQPDQGTTIRAILPLQVQDKNHVIH